MEEGRLLKQIQPKRSVQNKEPEGAHKVRIPGFSADTEVGLGDLIKRVTTMAGIPPCGHCSDRATVLNNWLLFSGRR
jgi:hypothetical protein